MQYFKDYCEHFGTSATLFRTTLFESSRLQVALNALEPGQAQPQHAHASQDTVYVVLEGEGTFVIGHERNVAGPGIIAWAPAGVEHGVENTGGVSLVLLVGVAPAAAG